MTPATVVAALLLTGVAVYGWLGWRDRRACAWANVTCSEEDE
jgi:hypothetical protein